MSEENTGAVSESVTEEPAPVLEEAEEAAQETPEGEEKTEDAPEDTGEEAKAETEDESEGSDGDEPAGEEKPEEKPKRNRPGKAQRQLTKAQAEIDALKEMVYALVGEKGGSGPAPSDQQRSETSPRPKQEDFTDYSEFIRADAEWVADKRAREIIEQERQQFRKSQAQRSQQAAMDAHMDRVEKAREKYEDFDDVAFAEDVPITNEMRNAILGSEHGADIQYYLGSHPDEAARITRMDAYAQVREIGKLEGKLTAKPPKKSTTAPPPPKTLRGGGKPEKDPAKMTQVEYEAWRNKKAS